MKQFNLEEYLRLKGEGQEPKLVTEFGDDARVICTDANSKFYPVIILVGIDDVVPFSVTKDGRKFLGDSVYLFFADLEEEPKYRPYKNADEFIEAQKEHGPYIKAYGQYFKPTLVDDSCIVTACTSGANTFTYERVFELYSWQDGSCCGVKEEDGRTLELVDGRRMEV